MLARNPSVPRRALRVLLCSACLLTTVAAHADAQAGAQIATPPAPATAPPSTPATCCRSTDDFPWQDLPAAGQSAEVTLTDTSPTYRFHAGDSHFLAFRLPVATAPYRIELRALPTPAPMQPGGWSVFYPEAVLLDADHLVSRTAPVENLVLEPVGSELAPQGAYTLFLPVDPAADGEKFLVIHTVPAAAAPEASPQGLQARGAAMRAAAGWHAGASDTGRLRVSVVTGSDRPR